MKEKEYQIKAGTTPTITLKSDLDCSKAEALFITIKTNTCRKIEKTMDDIKLQETPDGKSIFVFKLSQEETLYLQKSEYFELEVRVRIGTSGLVSNRLTIRTSNVLKNGVI